MTLKIREPKLPEPKSPLEALKQDIYYRDHYIEKLKEMIDLKNKQLKAVVELVKERDPGLGKQLSELLGDGNL